MPFDSNSRILITGGTGSFGKAFLKNITKFYPEIKRIVIYSRDELKQWELKGLYPEEKYPQSHLDKYENEIFIEHKLIA